MYISELFWNLLSFIHNNRIIMGGPLFLSTHCILKPGLHDVISISSSTSKQNFPFLPMLILCLFICVNITIVLVLTLCLLHRVNQA